MLFYLLSLLTGILECGWIAYGAIHSLPIWQILCFPLAYQLGNLFPKPFSLNRTVLIGFAATSILTSCLTFLNSMPAPVATLLTCITLFLLSTVIQSVRSDLKSSGNRLTKRIFRVGGFALAPFAAAIPTTILLLSSFVALYSLKACRNVSSISRMRGQRGFSAVMLFHQLHYFFYAHITLIGVSLTLSQQSFVGIIFAALLFCGTWVTYMSVEPVLSRFTDRIMPIFYVGHIGVSILLLIMHFIPSGRAFIILWLLTGFGGGAVYTISTKAKALGSYDKTSMTIAENLGHTLGLIIAVCVASLSGNASPRLMLIFGAVSALLAVIEMTIITKRSTTAKGSDGNNSQKGDQL